MLDWLLQNASYFGIVLFFVLTGCGLPIPEEVAIIGSGIAAAAGSLDPWGAFIACLVGALLGDCVMYAIGYHFGHGLAKRHPYFAQLFHAEREGQIEEMMRRHGFKVFFLARFAVGLRSPVYLTAGILRISFRRFLLVDAFCATAVVGTFYWLSYQYGEPIRKWILKLDLLVTVTVVLALIVTGVYFWRLWVKQRWSLPGGANELTIDVNPCLSEPKLTSPRNSSDGHSSQKSSEANAPTSA